MFELRKHLDLQMFGDDLDGVTIDDPSKTDLDDDDDNDLDEGDLEGGEDFGVLARDASEEEEEPEEELEDEDPKPKPKAKEEPKSSPAPKVAADPPKPDAVPEGMLTKAQVEQIVQERLNRDPYRAIGRRLEQKTGMTLQQLDEYADKQQEDEAVNKLVEDNYMSEEEARAKVRQDREAHLLRQEVPQMRQQLQSYQNMLNYNNDKAKDSANPYVRRYEKEIDVFSNGGQACSFESAKKYILGEKLLSGELSEAIKSGAINKTLADINKQKKVKVQSGSTTGGKHGASVEGMDPFQRSVAASMGLSAKEVAEETALIERERQGKTR